jgi:hypothetical protein
VRKALVGANLFKPGEGGRSRNQEDFLNHETHVPSEATSAIGANYRE